MKNGNGRKARDQVRFMLAQDIFVRRIEKLPRKSVTSTALVDEVALAHEAAETFLLGDEVWKETDDNG